MSPNAAATATLLDPAPTRDLAELALGLRFEDVPPATRERAGTLVLDAIANGVFGATQPAPTMVREDAVARCRPGPAVVWGAADHLDGAAAALANGTAAHGFEFDDYLPAGKTHVGAVVVPAALAVAGEATTGPELLTAIIASYDVVERVSLALDGASARRRGWHVTGLVGPFGAAAAAGRLLGLDAGQLIQAFGVAASSAAGTFAFSAEGAMTKGWHAGRAAEAGVLAARLARRGFTGPTRALDATDGGLLRAASDAPDPSLLSGPRDGTFAVDAAAIKPYPCCGSVHSSIDAVLALRERHRLTADDVAGIEAANSAGVLLQCGFEYTGAGGPVEAQMSMQYCLAAALVDGAVGVEQFAERRRRDPGLIAVARRVTATVDPEIDAIYPREFPAIVRVRTADGSTLEEHVDAPRAMSHDDTVAKALELTAGILEPEAQRELLELAGDLGAVRRACDLQRVLAVAR